MDKFMLSMFKVMFGAFISMAVIGLAYEKINVENYASTMSYVMQTAVDAAINNNQIVNTEFNYNDTEYTNFISSVTAASSDLEVLNYIRPGYGASIYIQRGMIPQSFGVAYLDKERLELDTKSYLKMLLQSQGGHLKVGRIFNKSEYKNMTSSSQIVNNGVIEILLDTVDVGLKYRVYDEKDPFLNRRLLGINNLDNLDTGYGFMSDVVVWEVTVSVMTVLPYGTSTMQWFTGEYGREFKETYRTYYYLTR